MAPSLIFVWGMGYGGLPIFNWGMGYEIWGMEYGVWEGHLKTSCKKSPSLENFWGMGHGVWGMRMESYRKKSGCAGRNNSARALKLLT